MAKIRLMSDVHTEFHKDGGKAFIDSLDPSGCDMLVLAGDISNALGIHNSLEMFCKRFKDVPVLHVPGNHEYYSGTRSLTRQAIERVKADNFFDMNVRVRRFYGTRALGGTLWYDNDLYAPQTSMSDFYAIKDLRPNDPDNWIYSENYRIEEFLWDDMLPGDVVVTHHLPSPVCTPKRFENNPLNPFFVHDMTSLIQARKPALWCMGHTHDRIDVSIPWSDGTGSTRLVCNPVGYPGQATGFDPMFTVEV